MKRKSILAFSFALAFTAVAAYVFAQQIEPAENSDKLAEAIELINDGKPHQARGVITKIPASDPSHGEAQFYDALALHETQDKLGFLKKLDSLKTNEAIISVQLNEELAVRELDALFHYRKFDEVLNNAQAFKQTNPNSPQLQIVEEHCLAALFERGMKKTTEACSTKDEVQFNKRWAEGKSNLEQFLVLASSFKDTNYTVIKKHTLSEDIRVARLTLGDEKAVLEEVPIQDLVEREKVGLLRVRLYQKLQSENVDRNLGMMKDFIRDFPESKSRKRMEFDMANISFPSGKQMCLEAEALEQAGDSTGAASRRESASKYFELQRSLQNQTADKSAGVDATEIFDLRGDLLYGYFLEKNFAELSNLIAAMLAGSTTNDATWAMAKVYEGIALQSQTPPNTKEAIIIFDQILKLEFTNKPDRDYYLIQAARWRSNIAVASGDKTKAEEIVSWVQAGNCAKDLKGNFLAEYGTPIVSRTIKSK